MIDFGELPVFADAATFPTIVLARKIPPTSKPTLFAKIQSLGFASLEAAVQEHPIYIDQTRFQEENWQLTGDEATQLLEKLKQNTVPLGDYVEDKLFRGVLTGLNEAFVIDRATRNRLIAEDPASAEVIKPFVVGDNVRHYQIDFEERYVIVIPKGATRYPFIKAAFDEEVRFAEEKGIVIQNLDKMWRRLDRTIVVPYEIALASISKKYPVIIRHLKRYEEEAINRTDKGDFWWELRACDYYEEFDKLKIIFPDIAKEPRMSFDRNGLYMGNTAYFIPTEDVSLLAILNSKLIFFYFSRNATVLGDMDKGGRLRWFRQDVERIPIAQPTDTQRAELAALANQMLTLSAQVQKQTHQLAELLQTDLGVAKLTEKLLHWPALDWPGLQTELKKQKVEIPLKRRAEWQSFFVDERAAVLALQTRRTDTDAQIDALVYALYGLTDAEIKIVAGR